VLPDIGTPGIDGYQTCRQLRRLPSEKRMLTVAVTVGGRRSKQRARDAGFNGHIIKPVAPALLTQALREVSATNCRSAVDRSESEGRLGDRQPRSPR
jgi:Response regulator containing a CheY-like receiver domain and a GGDEF domain